MRWALAVVLFLSVGATVYGSSDFDFPPCVSTCISLGNSNPFKHKSLCTNAQGDLLDYVVGCIAKFCTTSQVDADFLDIMKKGCEDKQVPIPDEKMEEAHVLASSLQGAGRPTAITVVITRSSTLKGFTTIAPIRTTTSISAQPASTSESEPSSTSSETREATAQPVTTPDETSSSSTSTKTSTSESSEAPQTSSSEQQANRASTSDEADTSSSSTTVSKALESTPTSTRSARDRDPTDSSPFGGPIGAGHSNGPCRILAGVSLIVAVGFF